MPPCRPLVDLAARTRANRRRAQPRCAERRRRGCPGLDAPRGRACGSARCRCSTSSGSASSRSASWSGVSLLFDIGELHATTYARVKRPGRRRARRRRARRCWSCWCRSCCWAMSSRTGARCSSGRPAAGRHGVHVRDVEVPHDAGGASRRRRGTCVDRRRTTIASRRSVGVLRRNAPRRAPAGGERAAG